MDSKTIAVAAVLRSGNEVLLVSKSKKYWKFPGGMLLPGERHAEGACRKVKAETGLDIDGIRLQTLTSCQKTSSHVLHLLGADLPNSAFEHLRDTGPNGHHLLRCPVLGLGATALSQYHAILWQRILKRDSSNK